MGSTISAIVFVILSLAATSVLAEDMCRRPREKEVFGFDTARGKTMSLFAGDAGKETEYLVYRYGKIRAVELEFPKDKRHSFSRFTYSYYLRGGGSANEGLDLNYLTFENDGMKYTIYSEYTASDDRTVAGIRIELPKGGEEIEIRADSKTVRGTLIDFRDRYPVSKEP